MNRRVVIFTGSRHLTGDYWQRLTPILEKAVADEAWCLVGDNADGLDAMVRMHLNGIRFHPRRQAYPRLLVFFADWKAHKKAAGPLRNEEMVNKAIELAIENDVQIECFAFFMRRMKCSGTRDCVRRAKEAGASIHTFGD